MFGFGKKPAPPKVSAVLLADEDDHSPQGGGNLELVLDEIPVAVRSIAALQQCGAVDEIVVVCREQSIPDMYYLAREFGLDKVTSVVRSGASRQESVFQGVEACDSEAACYLIHDGARPLAEPEDMTSCVEQALEQGAAVVGIAVKDTIKLCDEECHILSTPSRKGLVAVQTPQAFRGDLYRSVMDKVKRSGRLFEDDCQMVEAMGHRVRVAWGQPHNIRISSSQDLALAEALIRSREEEPELWQE